MRHVTDIIATINTALTLFFVLLVMSELHWEFKQTDRVFSATGPEVVQAPEEPGPTQQAQKI